MLPLPLPPFSIVELGCWATTAVFVEHCESRLEWPLVFWLKETLPLSMLEGPLASIDVLHDSRLEGPLLCRLRYVDLLSMEQPLSKSPSVVCLFTGDADDDDDFSVEERTPGELSAKMCLPITDFCAVFCGVGVAACRRDSVADE